MQTAKSIFHSQKPEKHLSHPSVILVSSDGFRFGYQYKTETPNIDRLIASGTEARLGLIPSFPTLTFPNHYTIATGLHPCHHGIVNNYFVDPTTGESFSTSNHDPKWWLGQPIWETVVNHGHNAAVYFWAGGEVHKGNWTCSEKYCPKFNYSEPFETRVDKVLNYFDLPTNERPIFTALYLSDPDSQGHKLGPDDPEITKAVSHVDSVIGRLISGLEKRRIFDQVTIIFLGDHGMVTTCDKKYVYLEDLKPWIDIPKSWVQSQWQLLAMQPSSDVSVEDVVEKMKEGLGSGKIVNGDKIKVYLKKELPSRLHYYESDRIAPIIGLVEEGYTVAYNRSDGSDCAGVHGYDNGLFSMRSIFIGHGPRFERGKKVDSFVNVEVYNVIADILEVSPAPNNGSASFASSVLLPKRRNIDAE